MVIQFAIHLKGTEPYPAIIHPSFGSVPGIEGNRVIPKPEVQVHLSSGEIVQLRYQEVFHRVRPWAVKHTLEMMARKVGERSGMVRSVSIGPYTYELRRFLRYDEGQYEEFRRWTLSRVKALLGDVEVEKVVFAERIFSYDYADRPIVFTPERLRIIDELYFLQGD